MIPCFLIILTSLISNLLFQKILSQKEKTYKYHFCHENMKKFKWTRLLHFEQVTFIWNFFYEHNLNPSTNSKLLGHEPIPIKPLHALYYALNKSYTTGWMSQLSDNSTEIFSIKWPFSPCKKMWFLCRIQCL